MTRYLEFGLPDDTMTDVRIVHDRIGAYADWHIVNGILPYGDRKERYLIGEMQPNYPMPTVIAFTGDNHYMFDSRIRMDGMPLFRGYDYGTWLLTSPFKP